MAELAAQKVWPFRRSRRKHNGNSLKGADRHTASLPEGLTSGRSAPSPKNKRRSISSLLHRQKITLDAGACPFQPGAPQHPMEAGVPLKLIRRKRSHTCPRHQVGSETAEVEVSKCATPPVRQLTELEYLTTPPPSQRELSKDEGEQRRMGYEDARCLMLQFSRIRTEALLPEVVRTLLFDLEQLYYPIQAGLDPEDAPEMSIRGEAMLEEMARLIKLHEGELEVVLDAAKREENRRKWRPGRHSV